MRYDTPTDGISRKQFDRAMDTHIRRYANLAQRFTEHAALIKSLTSRLEVLEYPENSEDEDRA